MRRTVAQAISGTTNEFPGETTMKKMKVEEVCMKSHLSKALTLLLSALFSMPVLTFAGQTVASGGEAQNHEIAITCGNQPGNQSISGVLAHLDPTEPHTIRVSGTCQENVNITGFDRLKLIAQNGASITDASGGTAAVVSITDSLRVSLQGFTINGSGPSDQQDGLDCITSNCFFSGNTFQNAGDSANVVRGAHAYFNGDVFQDNSGGAGLFIGNNAYVLAIGITTQRNGDAGVRIFASTLQILNSTVQNNAAAGILAGVNSTVNIGHSTIMGNAGDGIQVHANGAANVSQTTITGNGGDGIGVVDHSTLQLSAAGGIGNSITGNQGAGILIKDLSFARFSAPASAPNAVTGNSGLKDVLCSPQFPATRGVAAIVAGGGTTNCVEP
jgi:hypothetical protein